nr:hypothetical protein [Tanacetum cinerariifolium]
GSSQNNINDKGYWDSGCSRHMTDNISYLSDYEPFDGGYVSFGQGGCKITRKGTIKTDKLEFENVYFVKDLKRLDHLNFKTMNKLVRHNLVRGLPTKCFENDHTCTACLKGKQHKASCKSKLVNYVTKPLHTLHMDLFGPTSTLFLKYKDENSGILKKFITKIENLKVIKVKIISIRADKFWKKTGKKISIQGSDVAGFDKLKVECFNCHKMGHFSGECRAPSSQDRGRRDNYRQGTKAEEQAPKALMAIDRVGWDWSYMENDEENHALVADEVAPTEFALMANTSAESKVFDNSLFSKDCKKNNDNLNSKITYLTDKLFDVKNMIYHYKLGLAQVESRLVKYKEREVKYYEKIKTLKFRNGSNNECIEILKKKIETLKQEKEGVDGKLAGLLTASKNLDNLIES